MQQQRRVPLRAVLEAAAVALAVLGRQVLVANCVCGVAHAVGPPAAHGTGVNLAWRTGNVAGRSPGRLFRAQRAGQAEHVLRVDSLLLPMRIDGAIGDFRVLQARRAL